MVLTWTLAIALTLVGHTLSCGDEGSCYGPTRAMTRKVRRMQPESLAALSSPRAPLSWGEINFIHTTDTHGWLEGHLKEHNYGADWGDYRSFVRDMKLKAKKYGVDLLVVDTGDLHDGNGLSDSSTPNGKVSNQVFELVPYDLLTIGNHELYENDIVQLTANQFSTYYGDRYLTSNVKIYNSNTGAFDYIGKQYKYFTTDHGIRIMAFGFIFDFTGNSNNSQVVPSKTVINETWFLDAVNYHEPIDLFLVIGHNPVRPTVYSSTMHVYHAAIRQMRPDIPIQILGGHQHVRDFYVYDDMSTGLASGRYCETLGWLSMTGVRGSNYTGKSIPAYVPKPSQPAVRVTVSAGVTSTVSSASATATSNLRYERRYLDWNRLTFEYHANGSQARQVSEPNGTKISSTWDTASGLSISQRITNARQKLNTTFVYGCAPQSWTIDTRPFMSEKNVYSVLSAAYANIVIEESRANVSRIVLANTGTVRFDLVQGPFTVDDGYIVSPYPNTFSYVPNVPYSLASQIGATLNAGGYIKKRDDRDALQNRDFGFAADTFIEADPCLMDDTIPMTSSLRSERDILKRQDIVTDGYITHDDFGNDGDDTVHSTLGFAAQPNVFQGNGSFPTDGSDPETVDVVTITYLVPNVVAAMNYVGGNYTAAMFETYAEGLLGNQVLPIYALMEPSWHPANGSCPSGEGVI